MKILQILLIIMLCTTPLCAEQALVLSEIEKIQESIWYLQKDLALQKSSFKEQQTQLKQLDSDISTKQLELDERIAGLSKAVSASQERADKLEMSLTELTDALTILTNGIKSQNSTGQEQTEEIEKLQSAVQTLRSELFAKQTDNEKAFAAVETQLQETRAQLQALGQDVGGRVEQISLWGAGALLALAVVLTIGLAFRRSHPKASSSELRNPPKHEM